VAAVRHISHMRLLCQSFTSPFMDTGLIMRETVRYTSDESRAGAMSYR